MFTNTLTASRIYLTVATCWLGTAAIAQEPTYKAALAAGAISVQEPVKKEDEDKRGGVIDAGGTTWWIATRVIELMSDSTSGENR